MSFTTLFGTASLRSLMILPLAIACTTAMAQTDCKSAKQGVAEHRAKGGGAVLWPMDILHQRIDLDLTMGDIIAGHCTVTAVPRQDGLDHFPMQLQALTVDSVTSGSGPLSFTHTGIDLDITLNAPVGTMDTIELTVHYRGDPVVDPSGFGGFYTTAQYTYNLGVAFQYVPHSFGRAWFPCADNFTERCSFEFIVKTPAGRNSWCNGYLVSESTVGGGALVRHWRIDETMPAYLASVASSDYAVVRDSLPSTAGTMIPVTLVARPPDTTNMKNSFIHLPDAFAAFEEWFGPYRWNKVGYVLTTQGAMEHSTSIHYPQFIASGNLQYETTMAHELAHQWFGDLVTCARAEEMYINEGFAEYLSYLFLEAVYGQAQYSNQVRGNHRKMLQEAHIKDQGWWALADMPQAWTYGDHTYNKGADVLHTLRSYLGDDLFREGLTSFLTTYAFEDVSTEQLRDHLTQFTGYDVSDYFADWILQPGWAAFEVDSFTVNPVPLPGGFYETEVYIEQKQWGPSSPYHNVPVNVTCIDALGNRWIHPTQLMVGGEHCTVSTMPPFVPKWIVLNEDEKISLAVTRNKDNYAGSGTRVYSNTDLWVSVTSTPAPFDVQVEEYWVAADEEVDEAFAYVVSPDRYWRFVANIPEGAVLGARFVYDGRPLPAISLDAGLMQNSQGVVFREDSLLLLYRPDARSTWSRFPTQVLNTVGSATDRVGRIDVTGFKAGEYTLAWRKSAVGLSEIDALNSSWTLAPNPAHQFVTISSAKGNVNGTLELFDAQGRPVRRATMRTRSIQIDLAGITQGTYYLRYTDHKGKSDAIGPVIVE